MLDGVVVVNLYTDATPHSIAAILPALGLAHAQAFLQLEEINRAEAIAALSGLTWACGENLDTHFVLWVDNASVFSTLRSGTGTLWRFHDLSRMYLSKLHRMRGNTFEVQPIAGVDNTADLPSREVLDTLHKAVDTLLPGSNGEGNEIVF